MGHAQHTTTRKLQLRSTGPSTVLGSFLPATRANTPTMSKPVVEYRPGPSDSDGPTMAGRAGPERSACVLAGGAYGCVDELAIFTVDADWVTVGVDNDGA